jgi:RNAse (barnase) inhibitor barstar
MQRVDLDAAKWSSVLDFHSALLEALGAPDWHGSSMDALIDSMIWHDEINAVKPPYTVSISGTSHIPENVRAAIECLAQALRESRVEFRESEGQDIDVQLDVV